MLDTIIFIASFWARFWVSFYLVILRLKGGLLAKMKWSLIKKFILNFLIIIIKKVFFLETRWKMKKKKIIKRTIILFVLPNNISIESIIIVFGLLEIHFKIFFPNLKQESFALITSLLEISIFILLIFAPLRGGSLGPYKILIISVFRGSYYEKPKIMRPNFHKAKFFKPNYTIGQKNAPYRAK